MCLQVSTAPSLAGVLGSGPGIVVATYGRTGPTDLEFAWSNRGLVTVERRSRGNYTITAASVDGTGNAHVTVLGPGAPLPICNVISTSSANPGTKIKVRCWSAITGKVADAGFTVMFDSWRLTPPGSEYSVLTTNKSNKSHTPTNQFRAGIGAQPATVQRYAKGTYLVNFPGSTFSPNSGVMIVSATGGSPRYCNLGGWELVGPDTQVRVDCYTRTGTRSDSLFTLTASADDVSGQQATNSISAWFDTAAATASYQPLSPSYHYAGGGGADTFRLEAQPGRSTVVGANLVTAPLSHALVLVSGYGYNFALPEVPGHESTANRCAPGRAVLDNGTGQATFEVNCYTPAGYPVLASYTIAGGVLNLLL